MKKRLASLLLALAALTACATPKEAADKLRELLAG